MNKLVLLIAGAVIVLGGGAFLLTKCNDSDKMINNTGQGQSIKTGDAAIVAVDACDVLTDAVAQQVLGTGATKADTTAGNASSSDVSVSNCNYTYKPVTTGSALEQVQSTHAAGLLVRAAKTKTGVDSNKAVFGPQKPAGVQDVSGYGDQAYFNPQYGQLNILKGGNWYILSNYVGVNPTKATLDQVKQLADALKANLK